MERLEKVPRRLTLKQIDEEVQRFFRGNKRYDKIPVPIEDIISQYYRYEIIPAANLHHEVGLEGYAIPHKKEIYIDQQIHDNTSPNRYNSTLAHEVGHLVLHREFIGKFKDEDDVISFLTAFDPEALDWIEKQAWTYARYLLLPSHYFNKKLDNMIKEKQLVDMSAVNVAALLKIPIANHFRVADKMTQIRIQMYLENGF